MPLLDAKPFDAITRLMGVDVGDLLRREAGFIVRLTRRPLLEMISKPMLFRRPHTDDMIQMCADLGVDVPDRNYASLDGKTYYLR